MYSFYGGRPGSAFVIARTFPNVQAMVSSFSQGANYSDVHYDEYVLINTQDRNDEDNGKIYRRGYNLTNQLGGAEYIGRISGPSGPAPILIPTSYVHIANNASPQKPTTTIYTNNSSSQIKPPGFQYTGNMTEEEIFNDINSHTPAEEQGEYALNTYGIETYLDWAETNAQLNINNEKTAVTQGAWSVHNGGLVSGKEWKSISWKSAMTTDADGKETNGYFSMRVPYPVYDFISEQIFVNDQNDSGGIYDVTNDYTINGHPVSEATVDDPPASEFPFYKKLKFTLPIIYPITITNNSWQGIGKLYDDGNNGATGDNNVQGTKRLYFNIPLNAPIIHSFNLIEISGRLSVDSLGVSEQRNTTDFNNGTPTSYFNLNGSIIKDAIFFKTTVGYQIYQNDDPTQEVIQQGNEYLYNKDGIINTNNVISFNDEYQVGRVNNIYHNAFGLSVDLFTNLKTSLEEKTDFVLVRINHLSIRFYSYSLIADMAGYRENPITTDSYANNTLPSPVVYTQLDL